MITPRQQIDFCLEKKKTSERLNIKEHVEMYDAIAHSLVALGYHEVAQKNEKVKQEPKKNLIQ